MSILDFFFKKTPKLTPTEKETMRSNILSRTEMGTGANLDERPDDAKLKDYTQDEIVASANPVDWQEKQQSEWRRFPIFNQNGSGSCVAQTLAKLLGILYWLKNGTYVHFSATDIYQRRNNKPAAGMWATDAFDIASKGVTLEVLVPSQVMTDEQMDNTQVEDYKREVGGIFKVPNYVALPVGDFDRVASTIQTTKKGVMVWFFFRRDEWTDKPFIIDPNLPNSGGITVRHSVTAIDAFKFNGIEYILIEDSWGEQYGLGGQRLISREFFTKRNIYSGYPLEFQFGNKPKEVPAKPHYTFNRDLEFSPTFVVDEDVKHLQNILKFEGLFPTNTDSTGYYGALTAKSVLAFQKKYKVASDAELDVLAGRRVGGKTRAALNDMYK